MLFGYNINMEVIKLKYSSKINIGDKIKITTKSILNYNEVCKVIKITDRGIIVNAHDGNIFLYPSEYIKVNK